MCVFIGRVNNLTTETTVSTTIATEADGSTTNSGVASSAGLFGSAGRAAFSGTVLPHPGGVSLAFTVHGPVAAFRVGFLVVVRVLAFRCEERAMVGVFLAVFAARSHAVSEHPIFVFLALTVLLPGLAFSVTIAGTMFDLVFLGALGSTERVGTSADRAARSGTVGKHPVGVGNALTGTGPSNTEGINITAEASVFDTQFFLFLAGSFEFGVLLEDTESVSEAVDVLLLDGFLAFLGSGCAFVAFEFVFGTSFALVARTVDSDGNDGQHTN